MNYYTVKDVKLVFINLLLSTMHIGTARAERERMRKNNHSHVAAAAARASAITTPKNFQLE